VTTPEQRTRAVTSTRDFLQTLATAKEICIPGLVQSVALGLLRHYPLDADLAASASMLPSLWSQPDGKSQETPRIAASTAYLRDAHNERVSIHTRMRCAFEAVYFCCCELAERQGQCIDEMRHPNSEVMQLGLSAMNASTSDDHAVKLLAIWNAEASPYLPSVPIEAACSLAERIHHIAASVLS
jgi:hypothetical protein